MRLLFIAFSLCIHLFGYDAFEIKSSLENFNSAPYTFYIQDKNNSLSSEDILTHQDLTQLKRNGQLANKLSPFWSRFEIKNGTHTSKHLILYNILPGTNYIDVYLYKNNTLEKKYLLGDMRKQSSKETLGRYSMFELTLEADAAYTIVSKVENYSIVNLSWIISDSNLFMTEESKKLIIFGLFGGVFILFSILSFILYSIHRTTVYLVVGVYTLSLLLYTLSLQGVLYNLDFGVNLKLLTTIAWLTPSFTSILFLIYTYQFFSIKERYKKFYYVMVGLITLHTFVILLMSYALFVNPTYTKYSFLTGLSIILNTIYLLSAGIYMKEVGSKFYLIGQLILICAVVLSTLSIYGLVTYYDIYRHLVTIALFIDIILLLIAQSLKTKHHVNLLNNSKIALLEHSRYSSIGLAINNITHQWKHPLSHIGLSILMIESLLKNKKESLIPTIESELPKISYSLNLMKKTIDEFSAYYSQDITKNDFSPKNTIEHVMYILISKILIKNVQFTLEIEDTLIIHNYEHIFSNIIMILIDNSLDEFKIESKENKIFISLTHDSLLKNYILTFADNAGGIKIKPIEKAFEYFSTAKEDNQSHGAGLAMAKMLIEERLYGDIFLKNRNDGVEFKIFIPQENN